MLGGNAAGKIKKETSSLGRVLPLCDSSRSKRANGTTVNSTGGKTKTKTKKKKKKKKKRKRGSLFITAVHFVPRTKITRRGDGASVVLSMEFRFPGERLRNRSAIPRSASQRTTDGAGPGWNKTLGARGTCTLKERERESAQTRERAGACGAHEKRDRWAVGKMCTEIYITRNSIMPGSISRAQDSVRGAGARGTRVYTYTRVSMYISEYRTSACFIDRDKIRLHLPPSSFPLPPLPIPTPPPSSPARA